jgi:hypothetical protein
MSGVVAFLIFSFCFFFGFMVGKEHERRGWCDKYTDRTEYNECMSKGAE